MRSLEAGKMTLMAARKTLIINKKTLRATLINLLTSKTIVNVEATRGLLDRGGFNTFSRSNLGIGLLFIVAIKPIVAFTVCTWSVMMRAIMTLNNRSLYTYLADRVNLM